MGILDREPGPGVRRETPEEREQNARDHALSGEQEGHEGALRRVPPEERTLDQEGGDPGALARHERLKGR